MEYVNSITIPDARGAVLEHRERGGEFRLLSDELIHRYNDRICAILTVHRLQLIEPTYSDYAEDELDEEIIDCGLLVQNPRQLRQREKQVFDNVNDLVQGVVQIRNSLWTSFQTPLPACRRYLAWNPSLTEDKSWDIEVQLATSIRKAARWRKLTNHVLYDNLLSMEREQTESLIGWENTMSVQLQQLQTAMLSIRTGAQSSDAS